MPRALRLRLGRARRGLLGPGQRDLRLALGGRPLAPDAGAPHVAASWGRYNFVLPYGRVIKRYDVAGTAEPVEPPAIVAGA